MFERHHVKRLNPCSRMALAVRGWGLEVALAAGLGTLWRLAVTLGGEGLAFLVFGLIAIAVWRCARVRTRVSLTLRDRATRRWFSRVLIACEVISHHGAIPRVEAIEVIPAGGAATHGWQQR